MAVAFGGFFGLLLLIARGCHFGGWGEPEWAMLTTVSPSGLRTAVIYKTEGGGPTVGSDFIVRVHGNRPTTKDGHHEVEVWRAYDIAPADLMWHSDDSLVVVVVQSSRTSHNRWTVKTNLGPLHAVLMREQAFSDSELNRLPAWRPTPRRK